MAGVPFSMGQVSGIRKDRALLAWRDKTCPIFFGGKMKWFKMDCDAQDNLDMKKLIDEWGWDWYGRYFAILGKIGMLVTEKCQTFALQTNDGRPFPVKLLANDLSTTVERLTNFCDYLAANRLIDKTAWKQKGLIYCPKLKDRADEYTDKLRRKSRQAPVQEVEVEREVDKEKEVVTAAPPPPENPKTERQGEYAWLEQFLLAQWGRQGRVGWSVLEKIIDLGKKYTPDRLRYAITEAAAHNATNLAYVTAILEPKKSEEVTPDRIKRLEEMALAERERKKKLREA